MSPRQARKGGGVKTPPMPKKPKRMMTKRAQQFFRLEALRAARDWGEVLAVHDQIIREANKALRDLLLRNKQ